MHVSLVNRILFFRVRGSRYSSMDVSGIDIAVANLHTILRVDLRFGAVNLRPTLRAMCSSRKHSDNKAGKCSVFGSAISTTPSGRRLQDALAVCETQLNMDFLLT